MPERTTPLAFGEYYHVYNRGNSKQEIFKSHSDYYRFMSLLYLMNGTKSVRLRELGTQDIYEVEVGEPQVAIGAYCLMPNHFHILLTPLGENGVSQFMKKVGTAYSMYFNKKYDRTGTLFEGKYKSQHANTDEYLKYLFSYIHLNPIKLTQSKWREEGAKELGHLLKTLCDYHYSSYLDYVPPGKTWGNRKEEIILNKKMFPDFFESRENMNTDLMEWLQFKQEV